MALEKKGLIVIETYPGAAQDILHIPRKGRGLDKLAGGLSMAGIKGLNSTMSGHELDAVTVVIVGGHTFDVLCSTSISGV